MIIEIAFKIITFLRVAVAYWKIKRDMIIDIFDVLLQSRG